MIFDDSDVKIFNDKPKSNDAFDEVSFIAEMTKNRNNGNIQKAKELGTHLAEIFVDEKKLISDLENEVGALNYNDDIMYQINVLLVFTAEYCLNRSLSTPLLSNIAVNAMYDAISEKAYEFYDRLDDAAEYSFYYLAVRKGNNIPDYIGASFAMLCAKEKDEYFIGLGKQLFEIAIYEIDKGIKFYEFV